MSNPILSQPVATATPTPFAWYFASAKDNEGAPLQGVTDFESFAQVLRFAVENCTITDPPNWDEKTINAHKVALPAFGPYVLTGRRCNENVARVTLLNWDLDTMPRAATDTLIALLGRLGWRGFMYESPSSGLKGTEPRYRLVMSIDRPIVHVEWASLKPYLARALGLAFDPGAEKLSQIAFVGRFAGTPPRRWIEFAGKPVCVDVELAAARAAAPVMPAIGPWAPRPQQEPEHAGEVVSRKDLLKLAKRLQRASVDTKQPTLGRMLEKALCGERFVEGGHRHDWNLRIAYVVGASFKHASATQLAEFFAASLSHQDGKNVAEFAHLIRSGQQKRPIVDPDLAVAMLSLARPPREPPIPINRQYRAPKLTLRGAT